MTRKKLGKNISPSVGIIDSQSVKSASYGGEHRGVNGNKKINGRKPLPKRWVIERSFAWLNGFRRLAKDYEKLTQTCETMIMIAFACLMLNNKIFD